MRWAQGDYRRRGRLSLMAAGLAFTTYAAQALLVLHAALVRVEEPCLERLLGERYRAYCRRTPRYLGRPAPKARED